MEYATDVMFRSAASLAELYPLVAASCHVSVW